MDARTYPWERVATAGVAVFEITAYDVAQVAPGLEGLKG